LGPRRDDFAAPGSDTAELGQVAGFPETHHDKTMKLLHATLLVAVLSLQACGGGGGSDGDGGSSSGDSSSSGTSTGNTTSDTTSGFYTPSYGASSDTRWETDLTSVTSQVVSYQDAGSELASLVASVDGDMVQLYGDYKVKLISASKNSCPDNLEGCNTTDSATLGVGKNALVAGLSDLKGSIRDQSERGTCVAFALNGGAELLLSRDGKDNDLSEQNTYFQGKKLTDTWDSAGLSPYDTISAFTSQQTRWVKETYWPYNGDDKFCTRYNQDYPNSTCSETEAQGGGSDTRQQDPSAAAASGYSLYTAHQLYASIGRIKQALYRGYPVVMSVNANYDFQVATYKGGVVSWVLKADDCGASLCGHEVLVVGYQDSDKVQGGGYFIIKNSWSEGWGDDGLAYVTYEWLQHSLLDAQALVQFKSAAAQ
jgi:C1A family cysteine protease